MSFVTEMMVMGAIGSLLLGPKRVAKLTADVTRVVRKMKAVQQELATQFHTELAEAELDKPNLAPPITPSQGGLSPGHAETAGVTQANVGIVTDLS